MADHAPLGVHLVLDCLDTKRLADFWSEALGYSIGPVGEPYTTLSPHSGAGPELVLQRVSGKRSEKNRMHIDLRVNDLAREVRRLTDLGATRLSAHEEPGWKWVVLADPEGNEFCVLDPT